MQGKIILMTSYISNNGRQWWKTEVGEAFSQYGWVIKRHKPKWLSVEHFGSVHFKHYALDSLQTGLISLSWENTKVGRTQLEMNRWNCCRLFWRWIIYAWIFTQVGLRCSKLPFCALAEPRMKSPPLSSACRIATSTWLWLSSSTPNTVSRWDILMMSWIWMHAGGIKKSWVKESKVKTKQKNKKKPSNYQVHLRGCTGKYWLNILEYHLTL